MIRELHIKNLALIEELSLEFEKGFSVFTGETGAGKSILVGAIGLLLGERASSEMIRSGFPEAEVSGIFELTEISKPLSSLLEDLSIDPEDNQLVIRRKISRNGPNRILVNQTPLPLSSLKKLGELIIDFHGQHEHQSLLNENTHLFIIDNLPGVAEILQEYSSDYSIYTEAVSAFQELEKKADELAEKQEMLEFQNNELKSLNLQSGEEEKLEAELSLLSSSAQRTSCVSEILSLLGESDESIQKKISAVKKKLETLSKFDSSIDPWINDTANTLTIFTELETFCSSYLQEAENGADPARIDFINSRLAKIQRLKKKYSCALDKLIERQKSIEKDLLSLENLESDRNELQKKVSASLQKCLSTGEKLRKARKKAAVEFDKKITALMEKLGFKGGQWNTSFNELESPSSQGLESVRFLVRTNPGESMLPLSQTASGGEISRLMLAIKTVLAENDHIPVLIFDEIDTGIGGVLAGEVGKSLYSLSKSHQVLCISHLHQIASLADHHFRVHKETVDNRTVTRVVKLSGNEKVEEVARMLGGSTEISLRHARELLERKG